MGESINNLVRKPDAGDPHVRFDERDLETERSAPPRQISTLHHVMAAGNFDQDRKVEGAFFTRKLAIGAELARYGDTAGQASVVYLVPGPAPCFANRRSRPGNL